MCANIVKYYCSSYNFAITFFIISMHLELLAFSSVLANHIV